MESNHLCAKEVLPVLEALRDVDNLVSLVIDNLVRRPGGPLKALSLDVEPDQVVLSYVSCYLSLG